MRMGEAKVLLQAGKGAPLPCSTVARAPSKWQGGGTRGRACPGSHISLHAVRDRSVCATATNWGAK